MLKLFKIVVFFKLTLLLGYFMVEKGYMHLGDLTLSAADEAEEDFLEEEVEKKKEVSFLDKLFNLPEIDPSSIEKEEIGRYLSLLKRKRQQAEDRINHLKQREAQMMQLEKSLDGKLAKLDEERRFFLDTVQQEKELKSERVEQLTEFYKKMPPKKAAPVFEQLDKDLVISMFNKLPQKQITNILSLMDPQKSVELTEYYGRIRSAQEYEILREMNHSLREEFKNCAKVNPDS